MHAFDPDTRHATRITKTISAVTGWLGSFPAVLIAIGIILVWAATGPLMHFSDTWQLIINTFTTLVTFVMVFVIQNSQNRDSRAMQVKLDELLRAVERANQRLVGVEELPEKEIEELQQEERRLAAAE